MILGNAKTGSFAFRAPIPHLPLPCKRKRITALPFSFIQRAHLIQVDKCGLVVSISNLQPGRIQIKQMGTIPNVWLASADYCAKHAGGRPRKHTERELELVRQKRASRTAWKDIEPEMNAATGQKHTSEAYRALLRKRAKPARKKRAKRRN